MHVSIYIYMFFLIKRFDKMRLVNRLTKIYASKLIINNNNYYYLASDINI